MESENSEILTSCGVGSLLLKPLKDIMNSEKNNSQDEYFLVPEESGLQINEKGDNVAKLSEMCRTCASIDSHLIPIFKDDGLEHNLSSKIQKHLPIKVCETDNLPLQVCYHCAATLLAWDDLCEGVLSAQSRLLRLQEQAEQRKPAVYEENSKADDTQLNQKELNEGQETSFETDENPKIERLKRERIFSHSSRIKYFKKKCILRDFPVDKNSKNENSDKISEIEFTKKINFSKNANKFIQISENETLSANIDLQSEEKIEKLISKNSQLSEEKLCKINSSQVSDEKLCDNEKSNEDEILQEKEKLACEKCGKNFELEENFRAHVKRHSNEKIYTCHVCGKQFGLTGSLYYHLRHVHAGVKNHSCDICGRCFAMKTTLEDHRRIHTGERPYVCDSCGKTFKTKASLYIHRKTHTEDYPHKCDYCKRGFRWKQQMVDHLTTHTGVKNHVCDNCGKAFGVKNDLTRHKKIHSKEKPFACQQCGLKFGQKRYLKNHERTRH